VIKYIVVMGVVLLALGLARPALKRMGFGRLPGDFSVTINGSRVAIPLTSTILLSLTLSVLLAIL
jgi:hypothetical protein